MKHQNAEPTAPLKVHAGIDQLTKAVAKLDEVLRGSDFVRRKNTDTPKL